MTDSQFIRQRVATASEDGEITPRQSLMATESGWPTNTSPRRARDLLSPAARRSRTGARSFRRYGRSVSDDRLIPPDLGGEITRGNDSVVGPFFEVSAPRGPLCASTLTPSRKA